MIQMVFFSSGLVSVIIQTLLLREMLVVFQGNELTIGVILSQWMLGVGLGSYAIGLLPKDFSKLSRKLLMLSFLAVAAAFLMSFYLTRNLRAIIGIFPGEGISFITTFFSSFMVFLPVGLFTGTQFALGVHFLEEKYGNNVSGKVYFWESLGYLFGGFFFTYLLINLSSSPLIVLATSVFSFIISLHLMQKKRVKPFAGILAIYLLVFMPSIANYAEKNTMPKNFKSFNVVEVKSSPYAQIAVLEKGGELQFFYNGVSQLSLPYENLAENEEFGYLPLLFHKNPKNVLLIGGSCKYLQEILNYPNIALDYAEPDQFYIETIKKYWPEGLKNEFNNPRLVLSYSDGRKFLEGTAKKYDVILVGYPYPNTLALNRFFTQEFFALTKRSLSAEGVLAFKLPGSTIYIDNYLADLLRTIRNTVNSVFSSSLILPGDSTIFIAFNNTGSIDQGKVKTRFEALKLDTKFLSQAYLNYKLDPQKQIWLNKKISDSGNKDINYDLLPKALVSSLIYWQSIFAPDFSKIYSFFIKYSWLVWVLLVLWLFSNKSGFYGAAFSSGLAGMGLQMISIFSIQIFYGSIYHWIGILSALFMAGIAFGSTWANNKESDFLKKTLKIESVYCLWIVLWYICFKYMLINGPALFLFSFGTGLLLGAELPVLIFLKKASCGLSEGNVSSGIYAFDLFGGWFAAIIIGTVILPVWGIEKTLILLLLIKLVSLKWFIFNKKTI